MTDVAFVLHLLTAVIAAVAASIAVLNLEREFLAAVFYGGYSVVYGVAPIFLTPGKLPVTAALACLLGLIGLIAGRHLAQGRFGPPSGLSLDALTGSGTMRFILATQVIGAIGVLSFAIGSAGSLSAYMESGRFEFRLNPSNSTLYLAGLYLMPFISTPPLILTLSKSKPKRLLGLAWSLSTCLFIFYFLKGSRSLAIGILIGAVVLTVATRARKRNLNESTSRRSKVMGTLLAGIIAMVVLPNMYNARHLLSSEDVTAQEVLVGSDQSASNQGPEFFEQEPLNYSIFLQEAVVSFPDKSDYLWLYPLRRIVFFPLTSGDGKLKPSDTNAEFARVLDRSRGQTTIPPTLPGEGYVVLGGIVGVGFWTALYGFGLGLIEARMRSPRMSLMVLTIGFSMSLLALRGQLYEIALSITICLIITATLARFLRTHSAIRDTSTSSSAAIDTDNA